MKWRGEVVEEVRKLSYLGYMLSRKNGDVAGIKYLGTKANAVLGKVWGLGEKILTENRKGRLKFLESVRKQCQNVLMHAYYICILYIILFFSYLIRPRLSKSINYTPPPSTAKLLTYSLSFQLQLPILQIPTLLEPFNISLSHSSAPN